MKCCQAATPHSAENVYLVLDDFAEFGRAYRETDENGADRETVIRQMIEGQFNAPVCVIAFSLGEGWVRDVSAEIAREVDSRAYWNWLELCPGVARFVGQQLELVHPRSNLTSAASPAEFPPVLAPA